MAPELPRPDGRIALRLLQPSTASGTGAAYAVQHLPPIHLHLRLGAGYPSCRPPQLLSLSAPWLPPAAAGALAEQLEELWAEQQQSGGGPICFAWVEWLRANAMQQLLGQDEALTLPARVTEAAAGSGAGSAAIDAAEALLQQLLK